MTYLSKETPPEENKAPVSKKETSAANPKEKTTPVAEEAKLYSQAEMEDFFLKKFDERLRALEGKKVEKTDTYEMRNMIKDLTASIKGEGGSDMSVRDSISIEDFDAGDVLDKPVVFFTHGSNFGLLGGKKNGVAIKTPYNRMFMFGKGQGADGETYKINGKLVSSIRIHSKKEAEWLRSNSLFGIRYFEDIKGAEGVDFHYAEELTRVSGEIDALGPNQIIKRAQAHNITIRADLNAVKNELIRTIASKRMELHKGLGEKALAANYNTSDIVVSRDPVPSIQ